jgi:hypothetical protein
LAEHKTLVESKFQHTVWQHRFVVLKVASEALVAILSPALGIITALEGPGIIASVSEFVPGVHDRNQWTATAPAAAFYDARKQLELREIEAAPS